MNTASLATLAEIVLDLGASQPDKPALIHGERCLTYSELRAAVLAGVTYLTDQGVAAGDRVVLSASSNIDFVTAYFSTHLSGAICVPVAPNLPEQNLRHIVERTEARLVFLEREAAGCATFADFAAGVAQSDAASDVTQVIDSPDQIADLLFTTGTTGAPKGVVLSHDNILNAARNINAFIGNGADDVEVLPLPLSHSFGLGRLRCNLLLGATVILVDGFGRPKRIFKAIEKHNASGLCFVPAGWNVIHKLSGDMIARYADKLKYIEIGSSPMPAEDKLSLLALLPQTRICMHYGLTEASRSAFMQFTEATISSNTIGRASPNVDIRILDETGKACATGEEGEICVRGKMVTTGYWQDPDLTAASYTGEYFRTGDYGRMDAEGYLYLIARQKELINVGGRKVSPLEVESELEKLPGIVEAACVAIDDPAGVTGDAVKAYLVKEASGAIDNEAIAESLRDKLELHKIPVCFEEIAEVPKTVSGKKMRLQLKQQGASS